MSVTDVNFAVVSPPMADMCVLKVMGPVESRSLPRLRGALKYALGDGSRQVVLDVTDASVADHAALTVLVKATKQVNDRGGRLVLRGLDGPTRRLIVMAGLAKALDIEPVPLEPTERR